MIERAGRALLALIEEPLVRGMVRLRFTPNRITWLGLVMALGTATLIGMGHLRIGGLVFLLISSLDSLDGMLARRTGMTTKFGACLDSTFDRIAEILVLGGLLIYLQLYGPLILDLRWSIPLVYLTMGGSVTVSYVKARAEGLGFECKVGWMQRSERILLIGLAMLIGWIDVVLIPIALLLFITVGQRIHRVAQQDVRPFMGVQSF